MKRNLTTRVIYSFLLVYFFSLQSCTDDSSVNPKDSFISGTVTFTNANLNYSGGFYAVSLYEDSTNPFTKTPLRSDSLAITISGGVASAYYKLSNLTDGNYYVGATWISRSSGSIWVLGTYGCDTLPGQYCTPTKVTFPNYAGTGNLSFRSYTDINKALYYHH
jgi:hypothetical protein